MNSLNAFRLGRRGLSFSALFESAPFVAASGGYDIVHCHFPENGQHAVDLRDLGALHGKIVTQFHSYHIPYFQDGRSVRLFPTLFKKGDLFLTSGEHSKEFFDRNGWGGDRMIIHRYSVDVSLYGRSEPRTRNGSEIRLLSVGRLVEKKGFRYAIQGVAKIISRFPNIRYEIAGDGPLKSNLQRLITELGVGDNVRLLGWRDRDEVLSLLQGADIFLAPCVTSDGSEGHWAGDVETGPVVLLEAMASRIPVITTLHTGIPEFVEDGESGFLLPERDAGGIADRLTHLLEHPEIWQVMGHKGRRRVEMHHNLEKQNDRLVEIYRLLLKEPAKGLPYALKSRMEVA